MVAKSYFQIQTLSHCLGNAMSHVEYICVTMNMLNPGLNGGSFKRSGKWNNMQFQHVTAKNLGITWTAHVCDLVLKHIMNSTEVFLKREYKLIISP